MSCARSQPSEMGEMGERENCIFLLNRETLQIAFAQAVRADASLKIYKFFISNKQIHLLS
jgi:hypothetical protein